MTSNFYYHKGSGLARWSMLIYLCFFQSLFAPMRVTCKSNEIYHVFYRGIKLVVKLKEKSLPITCASLLLCSSHNLIHLLFSNRFVLRIKFILSLSLSKNFRSHFSKRKPWIVSGTDMLEKVGFWETMEFASPYRRADNSDGPGSKQQSRFHPLDAQNITRSKWSGREGGVISHLYLKQFCSTP